MWEHPKNVTRRISLSKRYIHGNHTGLGAWAIKPAGQFCSVEVKLFYTPHKLTHTDVLGLLEHICDVVLLLLSRIVGKYSEKVEHHIFID